ncbi:hypothetical protein T492DRAFT_906599, partial [Pavlovales sp. CCMP2436]
MACSFDALATLIFSCELSLAIGATVVVCILPSVLGAVCTALLFTCSLSGLLSAQTAADPPALVRVVCALALSVTVMFFVLPRVEEFANELLDAVLVPRLGKVDPEESPTAHELRRTLHFGEDALLCVFVAMVRRHPLSPTGQTPPAPRSSLDVDPAPRPLSPSPSSAASPPGAPMRPLARRSRHISSSGG